MLSLNRNFTPDSGRLLHLRTPKSTKNVRIDAGFVAGDEISSHYDPMIAKLIVRGATRASAIQRLRNALEEYEIVGPVTNIEFLKKICENEAFLAAQVDTNFIKKHSQDLFMKAHIEHEVYAQAALGLLLQETEKQMGDSLVGHQGAAFGFGPSFQHREFSFVDQAANSGSDKAETRVRLEQVGPNVYDILVNDVHYPAVKGKLNPTSRSITGYYPHTRLETTIVNDEGDIHLFQRGRHHRIQCPTPAWMEKALGIKELATSVLAPMPCKVLHVEVEEGDVVTKGQPLVVIESMKMETVITSPKDGIILRIVHQRGV